MCKHLSIVFNSLRQMVCEDCKKVITIDDLRNSNKCLRSIQTSRMLEAENRIVAIGLASSDGPSSLPPSAA